MTWTYKAEPLHDHERNIIFRTNNRTADAGISPA